MHIIKRLVPLLYWFLSMAVFFFCFEFFFPSSQLWNTSIVILFFTCEYRVEMKQLAVFSVKPSLEYGPIQFILFVDSTKISKDSPFSMCYCILQVKICHFCQDQSKYICFIFLFRCSFSEANGTSYCKRHIGRLVFGLLLSVYENPCLSAVSSKPIHYPFEIIHRKQYGTIKWIRKLAEY